MESKDRAHEENSSMDLSRRSMLKVAAAGAAIGVTASGTVEAQAVEAHQALSPDVAKKFFTSLYAKPVAGSGENFDAMATRVIARFGPTVVTGDQALQGLMFNYILANPGNVQKGQKLSAIVAGIKQRSVNEFSKAFPTANLEELVTAAKKAGYEVEVLGK